ncbi:unnamed protein product [Dicrocoelium dendriticum]|nr:unnamed protein product [Dicrocoelium dendriticum]
MAGINLQTGDHSDRFLPETALVPAALAGGSSNPPKFGTLIPNRIFVGGIPSNTTEQELKSFFSSFGQVKDVKIISDRLGVSKGSYGFVTFESQEMAEKIIKNESETLIFKDRKLNIGHAIRKQQIFPRPDLPTTLFFAGGAMPYGFQNGMAVFSLPSQDYQMLAQTATPYATMMLPQPSGAALYLPSSLHSATSAGTSPYAHLSHHQVAAAALQQQQQYQSASVASGITPVAAATGGGGGHLPSVAVNGGNLGVQSNSTAAVMAAAAAAMAAAVQWPQTVANNSPSHPQLTSSTSNAMTQTVGGPQTVVPNASLTPQQAAAMAAAVAAQQTTWRWSPTAQQPAQTSAHATSCSAHGSTSGVITSTSSVPVASTTSTPTTTNQVLHHHQQCSPTAALGPATYLYSPLAGTGHELMFFQQTSSPYATNSTSDYSTDHSTHSSGLLESEPVPFPCDGTPLGRHSQQLGQLANHQLDAACLSPYAAFAPLLELQHHNSASGQHNALMHPALQPQFRQTQQQSSTAVLATPQAASSQHLIPIAHAGASLVPPAQQHTKLFTSLLSSAGMNTCQLASGHYASRQVKLSAFSEMVSQNDIQNPQMSQTSVLQTAGPSSNTVVSQNSTGSPTTSVPIAAVAGITGETAVGVGASHR